MRLNRDANLEMLSIVADRLGTLREQMVFLGGCTTGLLITDTAAADVRATMDVDLIVEVGVSHDYHAIESEMRKRGFKPDSASGIRCRWLSGDLIVDLMPTDEAILGFSNRWYGDAMVHAIEITLPDGVSIRHVTAPYFVATKIEAFIGRGNGDFLASHDFEDIVTVIDGREELHAEVMSSEDTLRSFIGRTFKQWTEHRDLFVALAGHLPPDSESQKRYDLLEHRIRALASIPG